MDKLDLLSGAPKTLIFEKSSNKTNFGGSLTILYLIILLVIIIIYMVNYAINPKYSVLYTYEHQFNADSEYINKRYNNTDLNPKITFNFKMGEEYNASHFGVLYRNMKTNISYIVEFGKNYTENLYENLYDLHFEIYYRCNNTNNTIEGNCDLNDQEKERNKILNDYHIIFNYTGDRVDHQNSDSPIKKTFIQDEFIFSIEDKILANYLRWKTIKYTEERGILGLFDSWFGISNKIYGGSFMDPLVYKFNTSENFKKTKGLKALSIIAMDKSNSNNYIDLYSRTKKGIFDPIANICSLALTIYNAFILVFCGFYSNNYDNYKIVKKILSKSGKPYNKINEKRELLQLSDDLDKNDALIKSNIKNNEEENIIVDDNEEEEENNNTYNINEQNEFKIHSKFHFYDFLFNNFYFKKCCNSNKQNFVETCNEIVSRYNSVDYILYNQIKLENLFKDYKWNDPKLNDINNNQLIMDLKLIGL